MLFDNTDGKKINNLNRRYIIKNIKPLKSFINYNEKTFLKHDKKLVYFNMSLKSFNRMAPIKFKRLPLLASILA